MKRIFSRHGSLNKPIGMNQKIISVIGIGRGVGTTTVATTLAFTFSINGKNVTFIEGTKPAIADNLLYAGVAMDQRFANREFIDFYKLVAEGHSVKELKNLEEGINWVLVTTDNKKSEIELSSEERNRLVIGASSQVVVLDITDNTGWEDMLINSDVVVAVIDPLPSKLIANVETYKKIIKLENQGVKVFWVINKFNKGVSRRQVRDYVKSGDLIWINEVPRVKLYSEEFACRFHWNNEEINSKIMEVFTKVSQ